MMPPTGSFSVVIATSLCAILSAYFWTASGQIITSPCPNLFAYQQDAQTLQVFGHLEIPDLRVGQVAKVIVELSVAAQLSPNNFGAIALVKSRDDTGRDILKGLPAQYKITFPERAAIPTVKSITLNDIPICTGGRASGRIITTIKLQHKLTTLFRPSNIVSQRLITQQRQPPQIIALPDQLDLAMRGSAPPSSVFGRNVCGKSFVSLTRFIINGKRTEKGQFPWMVPLFFRTSLRGEKPIYICGSSLISTRFLVTAAHCVYLEFELIQPQKLLAAPGMHNIDNFFEDTAVFSGIQEVYPHPEYVDDDTQNDLDIAVLLMIRTMPLTPFIIPICLWKGDDGLENVVNVDGVVAGWGFTERGPTSTPNYFVSRIVSKNQCDLSLMKLFSRGNKVFCADGSGSSPCNGDSGSGFAILRGNQYFLRGIVSRGQLNPATLKCDVSKYGIYTDVAPFRYWLRTITG